MKNDRMCGMPMYMPGYPMMPPYGDNNIEQRLNMLEKRITNLENMYNSNNYNSSNYQMI